jgi:NAD(P)-dependent dehydrogenase (short-subunit alcohol dehydrogenase family)
MKNIVLVTGGGTGIGSALSKLLASKYQLKVLIIGRTLETLKQTAKGENNIEYLQVDLACEKEIDNISQYILNKHYKIKYLINNAVVQNLSMLLGVSSDLYSLSMNINVRAPLLLVNKFLKTKLFVKKARVLMIDSSIRYNIQKAMGLYAISKSALFTLTQVMRKELNDQLLVNSIYPGNVAHTKTAKGMKEPKIPEILHKRKLLKEFLCNHKTIKILSPNDSAKFIAWVLCETSDYQFLYPERNIKPKTPTLLSFEEWDIRDCECYNGCSVNDGATQRQLADFLGG